jgi:hypothetical protein
MKRGYLFKLFDQACRLTGHTDFVVIGSLSILGTQDEDELPADMSMSIDVDAYTQADPGRIQDLSAALGEGSAFHRDHGYYLDPVSPSLASLPEGWQARMTCLANGRVNLWFLDPDDAAVSKYARGAPNDLRWIRAGIAAGLISLPKVKARVSTTVFLDAEEAALAKRQLAKDLVWFEAIKAGRGEATQAAKP